MRKITINMLPNKSEHPQQLYPCSIGQQQQQVSPSSKSYSGSK